MFGSVKSVHFTGICGTAMASLAIESFSPRRLVETSTDEIAERVRRLHGMVHYNLFEMFGA